MMQRCYVQDEREDSSLSIGEEEGNSNEEDASTALFSSPPAPVLFTPWKILKAMDFTGFNLNLSGLEVLRRVDVDEKFMRGIIPSQSGLSH
jgi:hypothetical protein